MFLHNDKAAHPVAHQDIVFHLLACLAYIAAVKGGGRRKAQIETGDACNKNPFC